MIFQQHLESLGKENNEKVNKNKQGQKINLVVYKWIYERSKPVVKTLFCSIENNLRFKENSKIMS